MLDELSGNLISGDAIRFIITVVKNDLVVEILLTDTRLWSFMFEESTSMKVLKISSLN